MAINTTPSTLNKGEEFLYKLGTNAITDKHLQLLIDKFPSHRYINQMRAEQARRAKCQLNSKKAKESTEKTQGVGVCQLIRRNANSISTFYIKDVPLEELMATINDDRKTPKLKQKCRNEVVRRGYKLVWKMPDGTVLPKEHKALREYIKKGGGLC